MNPRQPLEESRSSLIFQKPVGQLRKGAAEPSDKLNVLEYAQAGFQPVARHESILCPPDIGALVGAGAQAAHITEIDQQPQIPRRDRLVFLMLFVVKLAQPVEEQAGHLVDNVEAIAATGARLDHLAGDALRGFICHFSPSPRLAWSA
jgi:hypothetical protein